jgi:hypothetical protein
VPCSCGGAASCEACAGRGYTLLESCPYELPGVAEAGEVFDAADLAKEGSWPILAGWLDQSSSLIAGINDCRAIDAAYRRKVET